MEFPKYFPDQCPPAESSEASGTFYRAVEGNPTVESDFVPYWLLKPQNQEIWITSGKACESCGLSLSANIDDLKRKMLVVPSIRNMNIAEGALEANMGKIKPTPSAMDNSHHTWWVPISVKDASEFFRIVA